MKDAGCLGKRYSADIPRSAVGFRFLPDFPIVEAKAALPWFGHTQIVLPAQTILNGAPPSPTPFHGVSFVLSFH